MTPQERIVNTPIRKEFRQKLKEKAARAGLSQLEYLERLLILTWEKEKDEKQNDQ